MASINDKVSVAFDRTAWVHVDWHVHVTRRCCIIVSLLALFGRVPFRSAVVTMAYESPWSKQ